ncbi:hypothetical protein D3P09_02190 [Paenibacillus pinisoli]|uniref:SLH domain-containing protein n=1 Tax=Paenibacillus pinisoli TaxID=1276110 RepID=A0A3A6Q4R1_9BACL|nr:N-acetylmuramoyl-L-alanine amidase [Paenibacillus pinisoli]RJX40854.1 hypothetical protein D3P09_02190 [Paenibacillus pinisoli]
MIQRIKINGVTCDVCEADSRVDDIYAAFGAKMTINQLAVATGADVAGNLPYAEYKIGGVPLGRNVVGGKQVSVDGPKTIARDSLFMLSDETMHIGRPPAGVTWSLQGSPPLLAGGVDVVDDGIKRDQLGKDIWANNAKHIRIAYGLKSPYELVIVRTRAEVTLKALAEIMKTLGCVVAINGDGGGSTTLYPADSGNGRKLGAALCIKGAAKLKLIGDQKPKLVIDPGHGGKDPGASGNGIVEKHMVLDISLYQYKRFKELGIKVALTRDSDITLDSNARAALVKDSGAEHCISNHVNSASSSTAAGVETIHSIYSDGKLATALMQAIADAGQPKRSTPVFSRKNEAGTNDYYFMHRLTGNVSTIISEYGFCSSPADAARLIENWKTYAEAVVKAYCQFEGHKYTPPAGTTQPPVTPEPKPPKTVEGFTDISGHWAEASVVKAIRAGILNGVAADRFAPDQPLTRAQAAVLLDRLGLLENGKEVK